MFAEPATKNRTNLYFQTCILFVQIVVHALLLYFCKKHKYLPLTTFSKDLTYELRTNQIKLCCNLHHLTFTMFSAHDH